MNKAELMRAIVQDSGSLGQLSKKRQYKWGNITTKGVTCSKNMNISGTFRFPINHIIL